LRQQDRALLHDDLPRHPHHILVHTQAELAQLGTRLLHNHAHLHAQWEDHRAQLVHLQTHGYALEEVMDDRWIATDAEYATYIGFQHAMDQVQQAAPPFISYVGWGRPFTIDCAQASD